MAKTKVSEWSSTASSNTDIDSINIAEGCAPSGINDAIRELMSQVKDWQAGTYSDAFNGPVNGAVNGTLGATTPASAAVTTLTTSSTVTHNGGTANGVAYLNGSKVLTTGSALTFDGTTFTAGGSTTYGRQSFYAGNGFSASGNMNTGAVFVSAATGPALNVSITDSGLEATSFVNYNAAYSNNAGVAIGGHRWYLGGASEQMRLTSTGLGIGTSLPASKLAVNGNASLIGGGAATIPALSASLVSNEITGNNIPGLTSDYGFLRLSAGGGTTVGYKSAIDLQGYGATDNSQIRFYTAGTQRAVIDNSGNLGLGVTPSAFNLAGYKAIEVGALGNLLLGGSYNFASTSNAYFNSGWKYAISGAGATQYEQINSSHNWKIAGNGTAGNAISFTQAMTLDASGKLLQGVTTAPSGGGISTVFNAAAGGGIESAYNNNGGFALTPNAGAGLLFYTFTGAVGAETYTERARIDSSGNWLVGSTNGVTNGGFMFQPIGGQSTVAFGHIAGTGSGQPYAQFYYDGTQIGSITQAGTTAVLYNTTSDQRLKENIADADSASALIDTLQVRKFDWKADGSHQRYGFIAQELVTVAPEAVHQPADPEQMMAVDYSKLVPMLVKEIQSLRARVAQLESN